MMELSLFGCIDNHINRFVTEASKLYYSESFVYFDIVHLLSKSKLGFSVCAWFRVMLLLGQDQKVLGSTPAQSTFM